MRTGSAAPIRDPSHGGFTEWLRTIPASFRTPTAPYRPSSSRAWAAMRSPVKPKASATSFHGAEAPKRSTAWTAPSRPTQRCQPSGLPASTREALAGPSAAGPRAVGLRLGGEELPRGHRHDAAGDAVGGQLLRAPRAPATPRSRWRGEASPASRRPAGRRGRRRRAGRRRRPSPRVPASTGSFWRVSDRAVGPRAAADGDAPGGARLVGVGRAQDHQVGHRAQRRELRRPAGGSGRPRRGRSSRG